MPVVGKHDRAQIAHASLAHMLSRVETTAFHDDPFPHISIQNFFPEDAYRRILTLMPGDEHYSHCDEEKNRGYDGAINRSRLQLTNEQLERLSPESQALWLGIRDALGSPLLKRAVFNKLAPGLAYRYGIAERTAADVEGYPRPELFREKKGFRIAPHPDTRGKVVTMQIALAADDTQKHLGTGFYRRSFAPSNWLREPRGFEIAKRMPFSPNAAYAFVVLNTLLKRSWHGRETLDGVSGVRNSILHIYYAKSRHANQDIVREQYAAVKNIATAA